MLAKLVLIVSFMLSISAAPRPFFDSIFGHINKEDTAATVLSKNPSYISNRKLANWYIFNKSPYRDITHADNAQALKVMSNPAYAKRVYESVFEHTINGKKQPIEFDANGKPVVKDGDQGKVKFAAKNLRFALEEAASLGQFELAKRVIQDENFPKGSPNRAFEIAISKGHDNIAREIISGTDLKLEYALSKAVLHGKSQFFAPLYNKAGEKFDIARFAGYLEKDGALQKFMENDMIPSEFKHAVINTVPEIVSDTVSVSSSETAVNPGSHQEIISSWMKRLMAAPKEEQQKIIESIPADKLPFVETQVKALSKQLVTSNVINGVAFTTILTMLIALLVQQNNLENQVEGELSAVSSS